MGAWGLRAQPPPSDVDPSQPSVLHEHYSPVTHGVHRECRQWELLLGVCSAMNCGSHYTHATQGGFIKDFLGNNV